MSTQRFYSLGDPSYRANCKKWYGTARWQSLRTQQLRVQPLCQRCLSRGHYREATVAHHTTPHRGDEKIFFDPSVLSSSCTDCHDVDESRIENGGEARSGTYDDGWPRNKK